MKTRSPAFRASLFGVVLALAVYFLGPTNEFGPDAPAERAQPPAELMQLPPWLAEQEAQWPDIREGLAKRVTWMQTVGERTPWSVVYVHGFTASRLETYPLAMQVAQALGANVFETRLAGHGRTPEAMGEPTVQDWLADMHEALTIGRQLGDRVLVMGVSTGATLATWKALRPEGQSDVAYVLISPNYGPKLKKAEIVNMPWGRELALKIEGPMRTGEPRNDAEAHAWTSSYPTQAVFPMMALVKRMRESDLSSFTAPVLMLYSPADETVEAQEIETLFPRIGSTNKVLEPVTDSEAEGQHVLAGDLRAPNATAPMAQRIVRWVQGL
jgi:alpha-beta hydrolase superfamily lysophospholipase